MENKTKPKYVPESENVMWKHINNHQDEPHQSIGERFGFDVDTTRKLVILWATGDRDSFNQAYYSLFEGSPTKFG
jgi:hypothetical protein